MAHILAPKMKDGGDNNTTPITERGVWETRDYSELHKLSESLKISDEIASYVELTGIPDLWARLRFFDMALYDVRHPFHRDVIGQWRGLLALIALNEIKLNNGLKAVSVDLKNTAGKQNFEFIDVSMALLPSEVLYPNTDWSELYIFLFRNKPIGITSPTTLVCTAADYMNRLNNVSWYNGVVLKDPIPCLNSKEKSLLAGWLSMLKASLLKTAVVDDRLITLIDNPALNQNKPRGFIQDLTCEFVKIGFSNTSLNMTKGIYRFISRPIGPKGKPESHVLLISDRTPEATPKVLFIEDDIHRQWGLERHDVTLYGHITLDGMPFGGVQENTKMIGDTPLPEEFVIKKKDSFFMDKIYLIGVPDAFPGALPIKGSSDLSLQDTPLTPLIPLKEEILKYISPLELSKRIRFQRDGVDISVTLRLPLAGPDGRGKDYKVTKTFLKAEGQVDTSINGVPVLQLWPNFIVKEKERAWNLYFSFYSMGDITTFHATPYHYKGHILKQKASKANGRIKSENVQMDMYPEAMLCSFDPLGTGSEITVGIVLLKEPQPIDVQPYKVWRIGIDFGTTGTSVYYREGKSEPERLSFSKQLQVSITGSTEEKRPDLYRSFIPEALITPPFLSVFHILNKTAQHPLSPLIDGNIAYVLQGGGEYDAGKDDIKTDLKWSDKIDDRVYTNAFLNQIFLQCSAEAVFNGVSTVTWKYSYPVNFSMDEAFMATWKGILQTYSGLICLKTDDKYPGFIGESESVASGMYFGEHPRYGATSKANFVKGVICFDIGGGTTDISIWHKDNKLLYQTSVLLAGRNLFLDILYLRTDIIDLFAQDRKQVDLIKEKTDRRIFYSQADALIMKEGEAWLNEKLNAISGSEKFKELKRLIAIGISGLFYYVGLIFKGLMTENTRLPGIYAGGNGSKLFHWIAGSQYSKDSVINKLLRGALIGLPYNEADSLKAAENPNDFVVNLSMDPKAEAAYGLAISDAAYLRDDKAAQRKEVFSGAKYYYESVMQGCNTMLYEDMFIKGIEIDRELLNLKEFVEIFNSYAELSNLQQINVDEGIYGRIADNVSQKLTNHRAMKKGEIRLEPLFILELKELLRLETEAWTN
ncbi:MAG: hypothetical protein HQL06_00020 [Nitrospirae bacterium]|nr:hypothetical protein [Nitrospirota bacterium]